MNFPLGRPILVMLAVALITGALILFQPATPRATLTLWTFSAEHEFIYRPLVQKFQNDTAISTDLSLVNITALNHALLSDFTNGQRGAGTPDLAEIEIGSAGKFFRPPLDQIGFEPIEPYLKASGRDGQILPSRLATWSKRGVPFGIPHDVHPVVIVYRDDLFHQANIDLSAMKTWPRFADACRKFQDYWRSRGIKDRHALEMYRSRPDVLLMLLNQRGINIVDDFDRVHLADPKVADTISFYARCIAGPNPIAGESAGGDVPFIQDVQGGNLCAFLAADWRLDTIEKNGGDFLRGKLRLMPLPRFDPTDAPTATYGGTMIAILKTSRHKQQAWKLIEALYFSPQALAARREGTHVLPATPTAWKSPEYHRPDPYFGNQHVDELLIDLARQIPPRYATPGTTIAGHYLVQVLDRAVEFLETRGDTGLQAAVQSSLQDAAADLQSRIKHLSFDN